LTLLKIGTRGSPLAMWQADYVRRALLKAHPGIRVELVVIRTTGDVLRGQPLSQIGGTGVFTKEIENALLRRRVDMAVHSLKDLPTQPALPSSARSGRSGEDSAAGLRLAAVLAREDPADALVTRERRTLARLPAGAKVLTGSPRRRAQLLHRRPDLKIAPVRGNVQTRLKKFAASDAQAIILARAGMVRLSLSDQITERLDPAAFLPACGQGAMAVEVRADDELAAEMCGALDDRATRLATTAERAFLAGLGGGCLAPVGAYGRVTPGRKRFALTGMVASLDGARLIRRTVVGAVRKREEAVALGERLAERMRTEGAEEILREIASLSPARLREGP
jgi:hydroxymethylbilane synthase